MEPLEKYSCGMMCEASPPDSLYLTGKANGESPTKGVRRTIDGGEALRELEALEHRRSKARRRPKEKEK
jgi:hypothetical protein